MREAEGTRVDEPISEAEVEGIAAIADPVARNLQITEAYRRLSFQLACFIGGPYANWCTYGIWSSRTIGGALNGADIPVRARLLLARLIRDDALRNRVEGRLRAALPSTATTYAVPLAEGNKEIFRQIGRTIARFTAAFEGSLHPDEVALTRFLATVGVDDHVEGIDDAPPSLFREGLACYYRARFADDAEHRGELVLSGSLLVGAYEQRRVQGLVAGSFAEGIDQVLRPLRRACAAVPKLGPQATRHVYEPVRRFALPRWSRLMTRQVMSLVIDGEPIALGEPLPPPPGARSLYPESITRVDSPALRTILDRYDCASDTAPSARDWSSYDDRMRFIAAFFRSRLQDGRLFADLNPTGTW